MKGISISDLAERLEELSKRYGCKLWIAERLGRRWSYVTGFGREKLAPARLILELGEVAVFGEVDEAVAGEIAAALREVTVYGRQGGASTRFDRGDVGGDRENEG